jgi:non-specific serine/threonine protein kinase
VVPGFVVNAHNARSVVRICARLDGIPLALELAAARTRVLTPDQILERLDDSLALLTTSSRLAPARQKTLRTTLDWSYELLSEQEQVVFRRLAAFSGGFDLGASQAVCAGARVDRADMLDHISRLLDKSLVVPSVAGRSARYHLLEPVRQYAVEALQASGDSDIVLERHAKYYVQLAEDAERNLAGPRQVEWLDELEREHGNLRSALEWSLASDRTVLGVRLAVALVPFWEVRGYLTEGRRWLTAVLDAAASDSTVEPQLRARACLGCGRLAAWQADFEHSERLCQASLAAFTQLGDSSGAAESLVWIAVNYRNRGDLAGATPLVQRSLMLFRKLNDESGTAEALRNLSILARLQGDGDRAVELARVSLDRFYRLGDQRHIARGCTQLGFAFLEQGELTAAHRLFDEALRGHRLVGDRWCLGHALLGKAAAYVLQGHKEHAARLLTAGRALHDSMGAPLPPVSRRTFEPVLHMLQPMLDAVERGQPSGEPKAIRNGEAHGP